ncbi:MAG: hypothetical protein HFI11_07820 [Lachnospiraceae bacterium]|nr:hypothetical protein [Lachnospiraceae bacterium]
MALNTLAYATKLQTALDMKAEAELTSSWMDANAGQVIYHGGRDIKIPKMSLTGLKDYDRDDGYAQGSVTLEYETMTMTMDRGTKFQLDEMDIDETNFLASATTVAGEFQRTKVVPEVDAYRYSKIAAECKENAASYDVDPLTVLDALIDDIAAVVDEVGENEKLVISINSLVKAQLEKLKEFKTIVSVDDFVRGEIRTKVRTINGVPLLPVPSERMRDKYLFADGKTDGQKEGGFVPADDAKQINWIIMPQRAPIAVCKQNRSKIFTPEQNLTADSWLVTYRKYHDLWIKDSYKDVVRASIGKILTKKGESNEVQA